MRNILIGSFFFFCTFAFPPSSYAQVPFGGLDVFEFPCTCSPYEYTWFAPLFYGPVPGVGVLAVPDWGVTFAYYTLTPGSWALGTYTPGVQACTWDYVYGCYPIPPVEGVVNPFTGTGPAI
jgi:hypothetical protein